jgi:hypothetical protein
MDSEKGKLMKNVMYEKAVNQFIPKAEKIADEKKRNLLAEIMQGDESPERKTALNQDVNRIWDYTFHQEMIRLTKEAGVRCL